MKIPLETMQELLGASGRASWILVNTELSASAEAVASTIEERYSGNQIVFTRDIPGMWARGIPSLKVFLNVVIALAVFISSLDDFSRALHGHHRAHARDRHSQIDGRLEAFHRRCHRS